MGSRPLLGASDLATPAAAAGWRAATHGTSPAIQVAPLPAADRWSQPAVPDGLVIGANHVAVTSDGNHQIFVGTMWSTGIWRYIEP